MFRVFIWHLLDCFDKLFLGRDDTGRESFSYIRLSFRLGYHFSTIEALVTDRKEENYVKFQCKGRAADLDRKAWRAHFFG